MCLFFHFLYAFHLTIASHAFIDVKKKLFTLARTRFPFRMWIYFHHRLYTIQFNFGSKFVFAFSFLDLIRCVQLISFRFFLQIIFSTNLIFRLIRLWSVFLLTLKWNTTFNAINCLIETLRSNILFWSWWLFVYESCLFSFDKNKSKKGKQN